MHLSFTTTMSFTTTSEAGLNASQCITTAWYFYLGEQMLGVLTRSELGCSVTNGSYDNTLSKALIKDLAHMLNRSRNSLSLTSEDRGHTWLLIICLRVHSSLTRN